MCIMNDPLEPPPLPAASIMDDGGALWCAAGWLAGRLGARRLSPDRMLGSLNLLHSFLPLSFSNAVCAAGWVIISTKQPWKLNFTSNEHHLLARARRQVHLLLFSHARRNKVHCWLRPCTCTAEYCLLEWNIISRPFFFFAARKARPTSGVYICRDNVLGPLNFSSCTSLPRRIKVLLLPSPRKWRPAGDSTASIIIIYHGAARHESLHSCRTRERLSAVVGWL